MSFLRLALTNRYTSTLSCDALPYPTPSESDYSITVTNCDQVSTPLLPTRKSRVNPTSELPLRNSTLSADNQQSDCPESMFLEEKLPMPHQDTSLRKPLSVISCTNEVGSIGCKEICFSPEIEIPTLPKKTFNDELYRRAEEFLDSLHFVIVLPEEHRRNSFNSLRVSTLKIMSKQSSEPTADTSTSEHNSPAVLSPSIHTSSLFKRRSSSKDFSSEDVPSKQKSKVTKSPFYTSAKGAKDTLTGTIKVGCEKQDTQKGPVLERSSPKKNAIAVLSINTKLKEMFYNRHSEILSAASLKMEEYSPLKIDV